MSNAPVLNATKAFDGRFYDSSLKMDFTDTSKENIDNYYSTIDNTSTGSSFINELYTVISKDNHFVKYADVNKWYQITDRNYLNLLIRILLNSQMIQQIITILLCFTSKIMKQRASR